MSKAWRIKYLLVNQMMVLLVGRLDLGSMIIMQPAPPEGESAKMVKWIITQPPKALHAILMSPAIEALLSNSVQCVNQW